MDAVISGLGEQVSKKFDLSPSTYTHEKTSAERSSSFFVEESKKIVNQILEHNNKELSSNPVDLENYVKGLLESLGEGRTNLYKIPVDEHLTKISPPKRFDKGNS
ncbi:MAG: hypothetical protein V4489_04615 [Chlamydiota bacterium]